MVQRGHSVTVVTASEHGDAYEDEDQGVHLLRVCAVPNPFWDDGPILVISQNELEEIAAAVEPEILHAHDAAVLGLQLLRLRRDSGLPMMATCYYVPRFAARYLTWNDEPQDAVESIIWAYSTWLFNQSDHVVFATEAHRDAFLKGGMEVPTTIISNGVDTAQYQPPCGPVKEVEVRYDLPHNPRILFVSRLAKDKEIDVLIEAMTYVCAQQEADLILVGKGDDQARLEELTEEEGLQRCVHFLGFVPEEDLPALYRAADLFAIASLCEVQSLPTLQAVATGLPVVAAEAVALPELVRNGVNGFLIPPGDARAMAGAILRILREPGLASQMGQASLSISRSHAEACTFD
jgi:glycosyltransferase involved in cell wall biosynthesis